MKVVVFDLDDTLYEEITYVQSGFRAAARDISGVLGVPEQELFDRMWNVLMREGRGKVFDTVVSGFRGRPVKRLVRRALAVYRLHEPDIALAEDAEYALDRLTKAGMPVYIVTDGNKLVQERKIRYIGLSNETPWGVMRFLHLAEKLGLPRVVSIQNPYNLLNRSFEVGLAEIAMREQVGLLAYSPLAMGGLTCKYIGDAKPEGARLTLFGDRMTRYNHWTGHKATERYVALAREHGLDPALMALAYVNSRPFVTSTIPGATKLDHIRTMIDSVGVTLPQTVIDGIDAIHREISNPCP